MSAEQSVSNSSEPEPPVPPEAPVVEPETTGSPAQQSTAIDINQSKDVSDDNQQERPVETSRPRIRLNPSGDVDQLKAIPNRGGEAVAPVNRPPAASNAAQGTTGKPASPPGSSGDPVNGLTETGPPADSSPAAFGDPPASVESDSDARRAGPAYAPVDLPPVDIDLDQELEKEIEAALAGAQEVSASLHAEAEQAMADAQISDVAADDLPEPGTRLTGIVQSVHGDNVFLDLGFRAPAVVPVRQFQTAKPPTVGQRLEVVVDRVEADEGLISVSLPSGRQRLTGNWDDVSVGQIVDCVVTKTNKGGLEVNISNLRGFLPAGQIDLKYIADLDPFVGQKLTVKIIEVRREKRNLVVSRRAYLEEEREEIQKQLWTTLQEGQVHSGSIKTLKDYGAFVDIGGIDGFLHIGQISWARIGHPSEVLQVGQTVNVKVLKLDQDSKKISLGMKQLLTDPWLVAAENYQSGKTVSGKVTRTMDFGAFVELEQGVEGMVHVSELDYKHVKKVSDVLHVGQEIDVQVLEVDAQRKRIALSLKALKPKPAAEASAVEIEEKEEESVAKPAETAKGPLKGGIGRSSKGGGLFGNPRDFS